MACCSGKESDDRLVPSGVVGVLAFAGVSSILKQNEGSPLEQCPEATSPPTPGVVAHQAEVKTGKHMSETVGGAIVCGGCELEESSFWQGAVALRR